MSNEALLDIVPVSKEDVAKVAGSIIAHLRAEGFEDTPAVIAALLVVAFGMIRFKDLERFAFGSPALTAYIRTATEWISTFELHEHGTRDKSAN